MFKDDLEKKIELLKKTLENKNSDYNSSTDDNLKCFNNSKKLGITPLQGLVVRLGDKYERICSLIKKGDVSVKDESIKDTLLDLAGYSILGLILLEQEDIDE